MKGSIMDVKMLIDTFQQETEAWRQMLECIIKENVNLKMRLAEILNSPVEQHEYIDLAETYQTRFIQNDIIIGLIRQDIVEFQNSLAAYKSDGYMIKEIVDGKARLQREILALQVAINDLKNHFNDSSTQQESKYT